MADIGKLTVAIGADVSDLEKGIGKGQGIVSGFTNKLGGMGATLSGAVVAGVAAATAAVAALGAGMVAVGKAAVDIANDIDKGTNTIASSLGISKEAAGEFRGSMEKIFTSGFGENFEEIGGAVAEVTKQLDGLDSAELENVTSKAFALRDAFDVSLPESINAVDVLMTQFGLTSTEALDFITSGFQRGLNSSDDFIDTIREYGNLFGESGASAGQFFSILETGLAGGVLGTDKVADLFKEFSIRIVDGSKLTGDSLTQLGLDAQTLYDQINAGSLTTSEAFLMILDDLKAMDNQVLANQIGVGLFGTQFEDLGASAVLAIDATKTGLGALSGASDTLNTQYDTLGATWDVLLRKAQVSLAPIGDILLNSLKQAMPQIELFFAWFQRVAIPWITEFVSKASDVLLKFFSKFDTNFGPALDRLWDTLLRLADAFGIATGDKGAAGMEIALGILEKGLDVVVFLFDGLSRVVEQQSRIWAPFITVIRTVYELIKSIVDLIPRLGGAPFFAATGGKTFQQAFGFAKGGSFIVPPGFPNDSFPIGVSSGEFVDITPANQVTNQKNFTYAPTYNGVQSSNPEMDYYTMNSLAG